MKQIPGLSDRQLKTFEVVERIRMAKVTLYVILAILVVGIAAFLVAIFGNYGETSAKAILGGINTLVGFSLRAVIAYLFPNPKTAQKAAGKKAST